jgi:hypothetical protein
VLSTGKRLYAASLRRMMACCSDWCSAALRRFSQGSHKDLEQEVSLRSCGSPVPLRCGCTSHGEEQRCSIPDAAVHMLILH